MNPIPPEREITKQQLWQRGDQQQENLQIQLQEMSTRIPGLEEAIKKEITDAVKINKEEWEKTRIKSMENYKEIQKNFDKQFEQLAASLGRKLDETIAKIDNRVNSLQSSIYKKIDETNVRHSSEIKSSFTDAKKELEVIVNNANNNMQGRINEHRRLIDLKLNGLDQAVERKAETEVNKHLVSITRMSKEIVDSAKEYKEESDKSMSRYQVQITQRFNELFESLKKVQKRFKDIADGLSS